MIVAAKLRFAGLCQPINITQYSDTLLHNHNLEVLAGDDVITAFGNGQKSKACFAIQPRNHNVEGVPMLIQSMANFL